MKHLFTVLLILVCSGLMAQNNNNEEGVVKVENYASTYRPGEVIVKFKAQGNVQVRKNVQGKFQTAGVSSVDEVFANIGVENVEPLMPHTGKRISSKRMVAYNGDEVKQYDLSKLYRLELADDKQIDLHQAIEQLQALPEVEFAEPNYVVYSLAVQNSVECDQYVAEPLYTQQWGPTSINLPSLWAKNKVTQKRPIIAIIDTGVDTDHPDLKANIWTNTAEANGVAGKDDDGNGIVDDIHGYDFVNKTGKMADFNGHGTHCAGIAAAVGHNSIGITGANPDALIMPITVMQSDGTGDVATIIKGIDYAAANGADVISMSLGGYSYSIAEEQALGKAYATAVIVAAAGNDHKSISDIIPCEDHGSGRMFPAAFQFVLGVESSDKQGNLASFSNYDPDGPVTSEFSDEARLYNYELRAPGVSIMSTFPKGQYRAMNGTSMACPLAAGAISRLLQCKEYASKELLFGDLINTRTNGTGNMNILAAYNIKDSDRKPNLSLVTYQLNDSLGDNDGRPDAGDTIAFYPTLRNDWGNAKNIQVWLEVDEVEDASLIKFVAQKVRFGKNLSSYGKDKSTNPIRFIISKNCVDGRNINLVLKATCDNMKKTLEQKVQLKVENGVELGGLISSDLTLYPDVHYIVTSTLLVPAGVTLTILPGATIKFKDYTGFNCQGTLVANGTPGNMITFTKTDLGLGNITTFKINSNTLSYARFDNLTFLGGGTDAGFENTNVSSKAIYSNCIYTNIQGGYPWYYGKYNHCVMTNCVSRSALTATYATATSTKNNCNIINNSHLGTLYFSLKEFSSSNLFGNRMTDRKYNNAIHSVRFEESTVIEYQSPAPSYLGSANENTLRNWIIDAYHPTFAVGSGVVDLDYVAKQPIAQAHGIVWKVVVNGYDAQDQFDMLPPLGVGKHKFDVYFNRPMNKAIAPSISIGVRAPYTQHAVDENGSWNADGTIYTAYITITGKTNTDGLNRIYVYGAQDNEYFEIPEENIRFNVQVSAAGSLSTGLVAEAGLGRVALQWNTDEKDFEDLLGYNIYRYTEDSKDTTIINESILEGSEDAFTDYDVVPGKTYYYYIKQLTTSLQSYDLSNAVAATPLTAKKGDANGSNSVDVADIVTQVSYLTGNTPQPFIFEAADVNADGKVNILDIVATVNLIINPAASSLGFADTQTATYSIENGILYVQTPVALGGVQFTLNAPQGTEFQVLEALNGFEQVNQWTDEDSYLFMAYSMTGKTLGIGKHALLYVGNANIEQIILSTTQGHNVPAIDATTTNLSSIEAMQMQLPTPNPFSTHVTIPYVVGQMGQHDIRFVFTNVAGLVVDTYAVKQSLGSYSYTWTPSQALQAGVYFVTLYVDNKEMQTSKLIHIK